MCFRYLGVRVLKVRCKLFPDDRVSGTDLAREYSSYGFLLLDGFGLRECLGCCAA